MKATESDTENKQTPTVNPHRDRHTQGGRDTQTWAVPDSETTTERHRKRETDREREREKKKENERREREREREREPEKDRETQGHNTLSQKEALPHPPKWLGDLPTLRKTHL